ncbi:discoidin domain-containing protein [Streptococcus suis]
MSKQLFDKRQRFSIRRFTVGMASVAIGRTENAHFDVHSLLPTSSYRFRVTARNPLGSSEASEVLETDTIAKEPSLKVAIVNATASTAEQANEPLTNLYDDDDNTLYHSDWNNNRAVPSSLVIDLGESTAVDYLIYRPRDNAGNGNITGLSLEISQDGETWQAVGEPTNWLRNANEKAALLPEGTVTRYIKINWLSSVGGYVSGNELTVMAPAAVVEEELVTDKLEPAYHEVPAFDLTADDDQDGFSNEAELLAGTDYADPASYPIAEDELVTEKGEPAYHYLPAFEFKVPAAPVTTSTVASPEPVSTSELSVPTGSVSPASATQSESASLPNTGDSQSVLALIGLTGFAARKRNHS